MDKARFTIPGEPRNNYRRRTPSNIRGTCNREELLPITRLQRRCQWSRTNTPLTGSATPRRMTQQRIHGTRTACFQAGQDKPRSLCPTILGRMTLTSQLNLLNLHNYPCSPPRRCRSHHRSHRKPSRSSSNSQRCQGPSFVPGAGQFHPPTMDPWGFIARHYASQGPLLPPSPWSHNLLGLGQHRQQMPATPQSQEDAADTTCSTDATSEGDNPTDEQAEEGEMESEAAVEEGNTPPT